MEKKNEGILDQQIETKLNSVELPKTEVLSVSLVGRGSSDDEEPFLKFKFDQKEKELGLIEEDEDNETDIIYDKLEKISESTSELVFQYPNNPQVTLTIEELSPRILSIALRGVKVDEPIPVVGDWEDEDYNGKPGTNLLGNENLHDYKEEQAKTLGFVLYVDRNFDKERHVVFYFDFATHLIQKDKYFVFDVPNKRVIKDIIKPWYYYRGDGVNPLAEFIYQTVSPHIKKKTEVVSLPSEMLETFPGEDNGGEINDIYDDVDMFPMSKKLGEEMYGYLPSLVISYLPTYFKNYLLPQKERLTGTTGLCKLLATFPDVPLVLKCYRSFIFTNLYCHHPQIFEQINGITELPSSISGRDMGRSSIIVYFNLPQLGNGIKNIIKGDPTCDDETEDYIYFY